MVDAAVASEKIGLYGSAWDESDDGARAAILEKCWAPDGVYSDPSARVEGREALVAHIGGFRQQFAGHRIETASGVDAHGNNARFAWRMVGPDHNQVMEGIDFVRFTDDGLISEITGFFGPFPDAP